MKTWKTRIMPELVVNIAVTHKNRVWRLYLLFVQYLKGFWLACYILISGSCDWIYLVYCCHCCRCVFLFVALRSSGAM